MTGSGSLNVVGKLPLIALLLTGCAYQSEVISGNEDGVSIKAGHYANPGPKAVEHCRKYGKQAVLTGASGFLYTFTCTSRK